MNVIYAPRALRDLEAIGAYLKQRNPDGAANVLRAIKSSIDTLAFFPQIGQRVDNAGHRRVPVLRYPYVVFYRIENGDLLILHVRHSARRALDPTNEL
jgi:addiction module RelE/StbE family toxin